MPILPCAQTQSCPAQLHALATQHLVIGPSTRAQHSPGAGEGAGVGALECCPGGEAAAGLEQGAKHCCECRQNSLWGRQANTLARREKPEGRCAGDQRSVEGCHTLLYVLFREAIALKMVVGVWPYWPNLTVHAGRK